MKKTILLMLTLSMAPLTGNADRVKADRVAVTINGISGLIVQEFSLFSKERVLIFLYKKKESLK